MPDRLPSGRWRGRIRHPRTGKTVNPAAILGGAPTYDTCDLAVAAEREALGILRDHERAGITVREWWLEWTSDPLWQRPSESTNIHYRERTQKFVERFGDLALAAVGDLQVRDWLRGGRNRGTVDKLSVMWNDAASAPAGRLVKTNPWHGLKLPAADSAGRKPPEIEQLVRMIELADELTPPSFAAYLDVAAHEGMRPGELDALRWSCIDFDAESIYVDEQWNVKTRSFTLPKHRHTREIALTEPAACRLRSLPRESEFAFTTLNGTHYTPSSRAFHWNRVRCAAGLGNMRLYDATRHYFGWYAFNVLGLDDKTVGLQLGHRDGGKLVRTLYGHPDERIAREKVRDAYRNAGASVSRIDELAERRKARGA